MHMSHHFIPRHIEACAMGAEYRARRVIQICLRIVTGSFDDFLLVNGKIERKVEGGRTVISEEKEKRHKKEERVDEYLLVERPALPKRHDLLHTVRGHDSHMIFPPYLMGRKEMT